MQPLLAVKKASVSYTENRATTLPGYTPDTDFFGVDKHSGRAPGYDFVFGGQPGFKWFEGFDETKRDEWLHNAADNGWISTDTLLNQKFTQTYSKTLDFRATIEPFRDLKIDLSLTKNSTVNQSQFFKIFEVDLKQN